MKNLVAKAGVAAVTSVLLSSVISVPEAKAIDLVPTTSGTLAYGSRNGIDPPELRELNVIDPTFLDAGAVEVGEFLNNETRGYFEFDLSSLVPLDAADIISEFTINLGVFSDGGTGSAGSAGLGNNLNSPFNGLVKVSWYVGSALGDPLLFDPQFGPPGDCSVNFGDDPCVNPLAVLDMSDPSNDVGATIPLDVSSLVKNILAFGTGQAEPNPYYFGIILQVEDFAEVGQCGANFQRQCEGVTFTAGLNAVPTPAAVLPSLFGLASAAFRKKRNQVDLDA